MRNPEERPLPVPTPVSRCYWEGLREHQVRIQYCEPCDRWIFYPRSNCPGCLSPGLEWRTVSGSGSLYSYTVARQPSSKLFAGAGTEILAIVQLDEGPRVTSTLVGVLPEEVRIGCRVLPVFDDVDEEHTLLRYRVA
jgi:uncharacterized protein